MTNWGTSSRHRYWLWDPDRLIDPRVQREHVADWDFENVGETQCQ
jgi:hypothetical protein